MWRKNSWILLMLVLACARPNDPTLPYYHTPDFSPIWAKEVPVLVDTLHTIDDFRFTNQHGRAITNDTLQGNIYVAGFFFTFCPSICPKLTGNLDQVADDFTEETNLRFVLHSVTPAIDSVARLKEFAELYNLDDRWHLLTGDQEEIYTLARQSYFVEQEIGFQNSTQQFLHTENFLLIDQAGHIRGLYKGTLGTEMDRLTEDIRILLRDQ